MSRIRWLILVFGPLPILGSSWALSAWFKSEPWELARNDIVPMLAAKPTTGNATAGRPAGGNSGMGMSRACTEAADKLKEQLDTDVHVLVRPPFVLAGDMDADKLAAYYDHTIEPAARSMYNSYFKVRPNQPVTVLLFTEEPSYERYSAKLFGDRRISRFGYYKPTIRTLVMNVGTGSGTLVHELTHALMDFDFPKVPDWFNEGLASLHEQCQFREDKHGPWIEGLVNWRLSGLRQVVRQKRLRSIKELIDEPNFRGALEGTNYAQARYLCLYLQQKGLLERFYRAFHDQRADDPRGDKSLAEILEVEKLSEVDADFQRWILELPAR